MLRKNNSPLEVVAGFFLVLGGIFGCSISRLDENSISTKKVVVAKTITDHADSVLSVIISRDGQTLASTSKDKTIKIWDLKTGNLIRTINVGYTWIRPLALSPTREYVVSLGNKNTIKIWNLKTGNLIRTIETHSWVGSITISPDGKFLVSGGRGNIKIWNLATGNLIRTIPTMKGDPPYFMRNLAISSDGQTLVSNSSGGRLDYNPDTNQEEYYHSSHEFGLYYGGAIQIWNFHTGSLIKTIKNDTGVEYYCLAISPDGQTFVTGGNDSAVRIWNLIKGNTIRTFIAHPFYVSDVVFSPDGKSLISVGQSNLIKIWNLPKGNLIRSLGDYSDNTPIWSIAISPDGQTLVSGSKNKTIKIWRMLPKTSLPTR
jgi:WD40 repeat protein